MGHKIRKLTVTLTATSGNVTGDGITGWIEKIIIVAPGNNGTVDLDTDTDRADAEAIINGLAVTGNADVIMYHRTTVDDIANANVTFDGSNEIYERFYVNEQLKLSISSATDGDIWVVYVFYTD